MKNDRIFDATLYCYDCSAKLDFTGENAGGLDTYVCPVCAKEGRSRRYKKAESIDNFMEYRKKINKVYQDACLGEADINDCKKSLNDIRIKYYSYSSQDAELKLLEMVLDTANFTVPMDFLGNRRSIKTKYDAVVASDGKASFPLSNDGIVMLKGCQEWLKVNLDEEEYEARVTYIFNFAYNFKKSEKPFKSNERFKECERELENLAQYLQRKNCEDAMYYAAYILVHTRNFTRGMISKSRDFERIESVYDELKKIKDNSKVALINMVKSGYENWLETKVMSPKTIIIAAVSVFAVLLIGFVIFTFAPRTLSTEENVGGISVEIDNKALPAFSKWNISLQVDKAEKGEPEYENANSLISEVSDRFELYDISLVSDQKVIQPGGTVKVTMHIPESFSSQNIAVYHVVENRKYKVEATVKDSDTVVFETNHFSFYAIVEIPYSVVFTDNFGHSVPDQKIYGGNKAAEPSAISQEGQDFLGWYCDGEKWDFANDTVSRDVVLVASWAPHRYTVTYAANKPANASGTVKNMPGDSICEYGDTLTLGTAPTLTGWVFGGWYKDEACTERVGNAGTPLSNANLTAENNGIVTLYAKWIPTVYTIGYEGNKPEGSSGDVTNVPKPIVNLHYDDDCTLANAPRLVGWTFLGWYRDAACRVKAGEAGESLTRPNFAIEENVTLYAKWKANTYTVRFDSRGGECSLESKKVEYDSSIGELPIPLKPGFSFMGWFPSISGGNEVKSNDKFTFDSNITLYAHYYEHVYDANFETFGGSLTPPQTFGFGETVKKPEDPTRAGYTFDGWYKDPEYTAVFDFEEKNYQSVTVYAKWLKNTYVVSYDGNKPYNASGNIIGLPGASDVWTYDESATLAPELSLLGWTFLGWYRDAACSEMAGFGAETLVNPNFATEGEITLYAGWIANSYTVIYDPNGGEGNTPETSHVYDSHKPIANNGFYRTGYVFKSWNTMKDGTGTEYSNGETVCNLTSEKDTVITLYAQWENNEYTVNYDSNGGEGVTGSSNHVYDVSKALNKCEFAYTGRIFVGWNTMADGSGTYYRDEEAVINLTSEPDGVVTLYAQWAQNTYTISYDPNGGIGVTDPSDHVYDISRELTPCGFVYTGRTFNGWNTAADGSGISYLDEESVINLTSVHEDVITLYAQWSINTYTVVYNANGGSGTTKSSDHVYDVSKKLTSCGFAYTGRSFNGWNTKADGSGTGYSNTQSVKNLTAAPDGEVTLYAQWSLNTYTVVYNANGGSGTTQSSTHTYTVSKALTANSFTRSDFAFVEWNTKANGSGTSYSNTQSVKNLTSTPGGSITLYAQWVPTNWYVTHSPSTGYDDKTITDSDGVYETIETHMHVAKLRALGYTKIHIKCSIDVKEINEGYQQMWVYNSKGGTQLASKEFECFFGDKSWHEHSATITINLSDLTVDSNGYGSFVIEWGARGNFEDDWKLGTRTYNITAVK